jgi:PAS domain S-box-containing protein
VNTSSGGWIIAAAAAAAAAVIFLLDLSTTLGTVVPMLYVLPIVITGLLPGRRGTLLMVCCALLLTWVGMVLSTGELTLEVLTNRVLATALLLTIGWLLLLQKQSARKIDEAQQARDESKERLRLAQSAEGFGTFDWDIAAQKVSWSPETERIWGLPVDGFEGTYEHWRRLVHPDDVAEAERTAHLALDNPDISYAFDHRIVRPDGSVGWIHAKATTVRDPAGQPIRIVGVNLDITERKQAEEALRHLAEQSRADVKAMTTLNELGMLSSREDTLSPVLAQIVDAAISIAGSDFGNIQLLDPASGDLKIVAQRGFPDWWVQFWNQVSKGQGACGTALEGGQRVIVEDIEQSPIFADATARDIQLKAGVRAVQSTPLLSRTGKILGMFSTHYKRSHRPDGRTLQMLNLLARQAADIIERTQAESALATAELHYRTIFQEAGVGVAQIDSRTGQFLKVNRKYCEIVGLTEDEMLSTTFMHITHPDDLAADLASMERLRSGELSVFTIEKRYVKKDGSIVWVSLNVAPLWQVGEMPTQHIAVVQDITARKRAEESLRKTQDLLTETEKIGHVGGWEFNIDTRKQTWTDEVYRIHELSRDFEPTVDNGIAFYPPESKSIIERLVQRATEAGEPFDIELEFITAKGNRRWVHAIGKRAVEGRRVHGFFQDITDRKRAEEALRRLNETLEERVGERTAALKAAEERFRGIFDHAAEGIAIRDLEGRYVQCNAAYTAIVGYTEHELETLEFQSLLHPDDRLHYGELVRQLLSGDVPPFELENRYITKSGRLVWVHKHASILRNHQGAPTHLLVLVTNITQRKRDEEELLWQRARLENLASRLLVAQDNECRRIARELHDDHMQRLAALALDLHHLSRSLPTPAAEAKATITQYARSVEQLTTDLQQFAHGLHPSILSHMGLEATLHEHVEEFERRTGLKTEVEVRNFPTNLSEEQAFCLFRVLQESLQNVCKHANASKARVRLLGTRYGVGLCVHDDGRGFEAAQESAGGRKGLGLISLRERLEALNGTFRLRTKPGDGTEVHAWIPLEQADASAERGAET